jgi:hypothetical protein
MEVISSSLHLALGALFGFREGALDWRALDWGDIVALQRI